MYAWLGEWLRFYKGCANCPFYLLVQSEMHFINYTHDCLVVKSFQFSQSWAQNVPSPSAPLSHAWCYWPRPCTQSILGHPLKKKQIKKMSAHKVCCSVLRTKLTLWLRNIYFAVKNDSYIFLKNINYRMWNNSLFLWPCHHQLIHLTFEKWR